MSATGDETPASTGEQTPSPVATLTNRPKRIKYKEQPFPEDSALGATTLHNQSETQPSENTTPQITVTEPNSKEGQPETPSSADHATPSPAQFPKLEAIPDRVEA